MNDESRVEASQHRGGTESVRTADPGDDRPSRPDWSGLEPCWWVSGLRSDLPGGELHLWLADLEQPAAVVRRCRGLLAADELKRADVFRFERHRSRFTVARGILRLLLGSYLGIEPDRVGFVYGRQGKPSLGERHLPADGLGLRFNVSHSGTLALYGFVQCHEIGVDIERFRGLSDMMSIARRSFAPGEYACLKAAAQSQRQALFFSCWTRKEAYIKAVGDGLSLSLDSFEVTMSETDPARIIRIDGETEPQRLWRLVAVPVMPGVAAAVCVQPGNLLLRTFRLDEDICRL